jgi:hypothetical protein
MYDSPYTKPVFLAVMCVDKKWHYIDPDCMRIDRKHNRVTAKEAFKPNHFVIVSLDSEFRCAKYNKRYDEFKLFPAV